jgi:Ohr subfamily peroxiredoxin
MAKVLYTARAHVTGGRQDGHGRSADGELDVRLRLPKEMGGTGGGTNPEELFAVGYAACFESALGTVARRRHLDPGQLAIDSAVSLLPTGDGGFRLAVTLDVSLPRSWSGTPTRCARIPMPPGATSTSACCSRASRYKRAGRFRSGCEPMVPRDRYPGPWSAPPGRRPSR